MCVCVCVCDILVKFVGQGHMSNVKVTRSKNVSMGLSIEWLSEFIDAKDETEEFDCTETTWVVFKEYAFFGTYN